MSPDGLLANLNRSQHAAVSSCADSLAILAGPGSGKTHTLTSRTAWLLAQGLQPWNVIVATFTVKAAREMKERIGKLLGNGLETKLVLGTFHSISRRYLARYGHLIDIRKDFGIADSSDSLAIIKRIVKRSNYTLDPKVARGRISGHKSRMGGEADGSAVAVTKKTVEMQEFEGCYEQYEEALKRANLLDYDDLLLRCVELLRRFPSCVSNIEAVLIDEFQDTNLVQFDLMRLFASHRKRLTIVGDPDQSIYGFRAAEVKNYKRMLHQYPDTVTIALEENYRSSGAILLAALSVIKQDDSRVNKSLEPTHSVGTRPVLRKLVNAYKEADWIVLEIQRCIGLTGELLDLNDFAILLRSSALSRPIESALGKAGIAYRMVGGLRFYDRSEVKIVLDYLRVVNQPDNSDAVARILNVPSRRIGEATIKLLLEEADASKVTLWRLILDHTQGRRKAKTKLSKQAESGFSVFADIILTARKEMKDQGKLTCAVDLIKFILKKTDFENWLEEHYNDVAKGRWANVEELITQASDFQDMVAAGYEDESLPKVDGIDQEEYIDPLSRFLANVALASEVQNDEGNVTAQITISTIHAAKGLEWPVVFIPAAYQGSIPHSRAEDDNEERRLLYVAMTRAKAMLYMSCPLENSQRSSTTLSSFISNPSLNNLLDERGPSIGSSTVQSIAHILRRSPPSIASILQASQSLKSAEDDLFSTDGDVDKAAYEPRWKDSTENTISGMGKRQAERHRIELGRSVSNTESYQTSHDRKYRTTMDRAQTFTAASATFVSASSLPVKEQIEHMEVKSQYTQQDSSRTKATTKQRKQVSEGQSTLSNFLGMSEPQTAKRTPTVMQDSNISVTNKKPRVESYGQRNLQQPTLPSKNTNDMLTTHRIATGNTSARPKQQIHDSKIKPYVFLSSPPAKEKCQPVPEPPVALQVKPPLLPLIRPPVSFHKTTTSKPTTTTIAQSGTTRKTLGLKRALNSGWDSRKGGRDFVTPTIRKPG